jgi:hypothetical protein
MILLGRLQVIDLKDLSRRTGLIVRSVDADSMATLFDVFDDYDVNERAETFDYLEQARNETRVTLMAEPAFKADLLN